MTRESTLTIGVVLPDVLGTYADAGNAVVLAQRARWRGIPAQVHAITATTTPPDGCDIYLLGGGEDTVQPFAVEWLSRHPSLCMAMASRATTLAVCAGLQILGHTMQDGSGATHRGLGILDLTTTSRASRAVGEVVAECLLDGVGELTGFENHQGATTLGGGQTPLGRVVSGTGNGTPSADGWRTEGIVTEHIIGTYLHGPVLARNPALADHILYRATGATLWPLEVPDVDRMRDHYLAGSPRHTSLRQGPLRRRSQPTATRPV